MNGILNIYKEKGFTSHDVVAKLRGIAKQRRIGHTGTLDPDAEGVLPVCLGNATKLCDLLTDKDKTYEAVIVFGIETDTQDITGSVIRESSAGVAEEEFIRALAGFRGEILQIPPMYSAVKVGGKKLYELARQGKEVEREARPVTIHELEVLSVSDKPDGTLSEARIRVTCSKGTYIRTICHDIGKALLCGACMKSLIRTRSGIFCIENSMTLGRIQELAEQGTLEGHLIPTDSMFSQYPGYFADISFEKQLRAGNPVAPDRLRKDTGGGLLASERTGRARIYDAAGGFTGIYEYDEAACEFRPVKMFLTS